MTRVHFGIIGLCVLLFTLYDITVSVISVTEQGPLNYIITNFMRISALGLFRVTGRRAPVILQIAGTLTILGVITVWFILMWISYSLIFLAGHNHWIETALTQEPSDTWDVIYYAGYVLSSLGMGDQVPVNHFVQIVTDFFAIIGFLLISVMATYMLNLVNAYESSRQVASYIAGLGGSPTNILRFAWCQEENHFADFQSHVVSLIPIIARQSEILEAYPVIIGYHSKGPLHSATMAVACFAEALYIIDCAIPKEHRPLDCLTHRAVHHAVDRYMSTLSKFFYPAEPDTPPPLNEYEVLHSLGLPLVPKEEYVRRMQRPQIWERRYLISYALMVTGWDFDDVYHWHSSHPFEIERRVKPLEHELSF